MAEHWGAGRCICERDTALVAWATTGGGYQADWVSARRCRGVADVVWSLQVLEGFAVGESRREGV